MDGNLLFESYFFFIYFVVSFLLLIYGFCFIVLVWFGFLLGFHILRLMCLFLAFLQFLCQSLGFW